MRKNKIEWEHLLQLLKEERELTELLPSLEEIDSIKAKTILIAVREELKNYSFEEVEIVRRLLQDNKSIGDFHDELVEKNEIEKRIRRMRRDAENESNERERRKELEGLEELTFLEFILLALFLKQFKMNNTNELVLLLLLQFFAEEKPKSKIGVFYDKNNF